MRAITDRKNRSDDVRQRRVLIVDDDRDFADALAELLEFEDYLVETVYGADQIEAASRRFAPDVALIDIMLGDASGLDQIGRLRAVRPDLVCVMITGHADLNSAIAALREGADDYLRKPLDDGEVLALLHRCFDKQRLEQEKKAAEQLARRLGRILDESSDEIYIFDAEGDRILAANRGALENLGYTIDELSAFTPADIRAALGLDEMASLVAPIRDGRQDRVVLESSHRRKDGTEYPVEARFQLSTTEDPPVLVSIALDITERNRTREQLHQALKMEAIGRLTGGVAHDFNNLMSVVLLNAELLRGTLDGDGRRRAEAVIRAARRGAELTQRLLAFARHQPLSPKVVDAGALVAGMIDMLSRTLGETIGIETARPPDPWRIEADPGQLENAILNLALNARDAMANGGSLVLRTANAPLGEAAAADRVGVAPGDYVALSVADTGTGMAPEVVEHAFDPFFTTKDVGEGSGLGLSMVHGFAAQSGGAVTIDSQPGVGTTVTLYLPRARETEQTPEIVVDDRQPRGRGEMVLLIEDDADVRLLVAKMLDGLGYAVLEADNGADAITVLDSGPHIDLLLSDVVLPGGMNGPEIANRAKLTRPALKVLFISGYPDGSIARNGASAEGFEYLKKPFGQRDLARRVRDVLDRDAGDDG